jgi:hypothetical protein
MFYHAIVTDTSDFYKTGQIKVRISSFYNQPINYNLADKLSEQFKYGVKGDMNARVLSSMGGGRNYGIFFLPQVNEKGIVASVMDDKQDFIWMGSIFDATRDEKYKATHVNIPSDDMTQEGKDTDGSLNELPNMEFSPDATSPELKLEEAMGKHIVLRTKTTKLKFDNDTQKLDSSSKAEDVDWEKVHTTNIVTIADDEIKIIHFSKDDGWNETTPEKWQEIKIKKDPDNDKKDTISVKVVNKKDDKEASINMTEDNVTITQKGEKENKIILSDEAVSITSEVDMDITITGGNLTLKGDPNLILNADGSSSVRFTELKNIIEVIKEHVHIAQGPAGPTSPPMRGPAGAPPIGSLIAGDVSGMESKNVRLE